jgi:hypothetical protein
MSCLEKSIVMKKLKPNQTIQPTPKSGAADGRRYDA